MTTGTAAPAPARQARERGRAGGREPGHAGGLAAARWRAVLGRLGRLGQPAFWLLIVLLILAPAACFLLLAVSPRLFGQGSQWFTLTFLQQTLTGLTAVSIFNSAWVSCAAAALGLVIGFPVAWLTHRTTLPGRRLVPGGMWLVLLLPSWLPALGWQRLAEPDGVLPRIGLGSPVITHLIMSPFGVVLLLGLRSVPFTYLAVTAGLAGLGQEFEDAARVHGAGRMAAVRLLAAMLAPAIASALAINFAEAISDFGVADTLAYSSNFPLATYQLYANIENYPPNFPLAAGMAWLLVAAVAVPLALQARALRGRTYAVLSGRSRQIVRRQFSRAGAAGAAAGVGLFYLAALGVPGFGAVSGSLLADYGGSLTPTLENYRAVFAQPDLLGPLERSLGYAVVTASVTVAGGFVAARMLGQRRTRGAGLLDFLLLAAVALPGVVFGAGYIFAYNLPIMSTLGVNLYQTVTLLVAAYIAASLPTNARVLVGAVSQLQPSLKEAARAHGAGEFTAWARGVLPAVSRPIVMAWLLTFCAVFLELPLSQLLYAPNSPPVSVAINDSLSNYHFGLGMAQSVLAVGIALGAVGLVLGAYRLLAPTGWRRIGGATRA